MAKDATPDSITLVNDNFANENHRHIAEILLNEWDAQATFSDLGDEYDAHRATFQNVYNRYFAPSEEDFNDGIEEDRTIEQIKKEYDSYSNYRDARERGDLDREPGKQVTEDEMERILEGYRKGLKESDSGKFAEGWNRALEQVEKKGIENVARMDED